MKAKQVIYVTMIQWLRDIMLQYSMPSDRAFESFLSQNYYSVFRQEDVLVFRIYHTDNEGYTIVDSHAEGMNIPLVHVYYWKQHPFRA